LRLILVGCEYAGKRTLARLISHWMIGTMGLPFVRWHDHFVMPHVDRDLVVAGDADRPQAIPGKTAAGLEDARDEEQILTLRPSVLETLSRHLIWHHFLPAFFERDPDYLLINWYYGDAVYAPLYYGYGSPGHFSDRRRRARVWDSELMAVAPDAVLVLVRASPGAIRERMRRHSDRRCFPKECDVESVLDRFEEEYASSLIHRRFTLDTTQASENETFREFLSLAGQYLGEADRLRILSHRVRRSL
jgi:hypothetical protein